MSNAGVEENRTQLTWEDDFS